MKYIIRIVYGGFNISIDGKEAMILWQGILQGNRARLTS